MSLKSRLFRGNLGPSIHYQFTLKSDKIVDNKRIFDTYPHIHTLNNNYLKKVIMKEDR
jgi:hypothetical protein